MMQSPVRNWDRVYASHPDHLATAEAAIAAVYPDSRNRWAHPELDAGWRRRLHAMEDHSFDRAVAAFMG